MFLVVMSTTWWAASLKSAEDKRLFNEVMDDIRWVIEEMLVPSPVPNNPDASQNPTPPLGTRKPISAATWQARADGKRESRPSRKLLETLN